MELKSALLKAAYGAVFVLLWPAVLAFLSIRLDAALSLWPVPIPAWVGGALTLSGLWMVLHGMWLLWSRGGGLPMNAFPPPRCVRNSLYALAPHPIYTGFSLGVAGVAVWAGSPAGFWLVAPLSALAAMALVFGYEHPALRRRFGELPQPLLALPPCLDEPVPLWRALAAGLISLGLWAGLYALFAVTPGPAQAFDWRIPLDRHIPLSGWTVWVYSLAYPFTAAIPFLARTLREARRDVRAVWVMAGLGFGAMLLVPGRAELLVPADGPGWLLEWNRAYDADWLALPSFHAAWAVLAAEIWLRRFRKPLLFRGIAAAICLSCLTTGSHGVLDVLAGAALGLLGAHLDALWTGTVALTSRAANSWDAVRLGPVRIIGHAAWSLLAASSGMLAALPWTAPGDCGRLILVCVCGLAAAGIWGYALEGGARLARPFGYFGYLIGALCGLGLVTLAAPESAARLAVGLSVTAPLAQAIGRMRCLVQGCCHGRACEGIGLIVVNPMSRVVSLARLSGSPIHPTQLYSLLSGLAVFFIQIRLGLSCASWALLGGSYLVLAALTRFVEEAYRGEPQTASFKGMSLYQWLGVGTFLAGLALLLGTHPAPGMTLRLPEMNEAAWALGFGALAAACMSVDFPETGWRFSCLTVMGQEKGNKKCPPPVKVTPG